MVVSRSAFGRAIPSHLCLHPVLNFLDGYTGTHPPKWVRSDCRMAPKWANYHVVDIWHHGDDRTLFVGSSKKGSTSETSRRYYRPDSKALATLQFLHDTARTSLQKIKNMQSKGRNALLNSEKYLPVYFDRLLVHQQHLLGPQNKLGTNTPESPANLSFEDLAPCLRDIWKKKEAIDAGNDVPWWEGVEVEAAVNEAETRGKSTPAPDDTSTPGGNDVFRAILSSRIADGGCVDCGNPAER